MQQINANMEILIVGGGGGYFAVFAMLPKYQPREKFNPYYSHITQTDGRPTVCEQKFGKSCDVGRLSADVGTDFGWIFGRPTTFLSKHPS